MNKPDAYLVITFDGGPLAYTDVPQVTWSQGSTPLSGGLERVSILTAYQAGVSRSDEALDYLLRVKNTGTTKTSPGVSAEVVLPGGFETEVLRAGNPALGVSSHWNCTIVSASGIMPAKATCISDEAVDPGASYEPLLVRAGFGVDAPAHALATATVSGGGAPATQPDEDVFDFLPAEPFGLEWLDTEVMGQQGTEFTQAGGHPYAAEASFSLNTGRRDSPALFEPIEPPKTIITDLPRGFVGNALSVPTLCPTLADVLAAPPTCPPGSAVGEINVDAALNNEIHQFVMTIYAIEPEYGTPVQFGFSETANLQTTYTLTPRLRADDGYAISLDATASAASPPIRRINYATLCGFGANLNPEGKFLGCKRASDPTANDVPLITNPTRCTGTPP
ncbi:MAG TPA: hypothetical protein VI039_02165, partial [Solirubrobacterales bacterium]